MNIAAIYPTTEPYRTSDNQIQQVGSNRRRSKRCDQSVRLTETEARAVVPGKAVLSSQDTMKYSKPSGGMAACGNRTVRATTVLLVALALVGFSAPAVTSTWDGGSIGDTGASDVLENFSPDRAGVRPGGGTFDFAGGIVAANNQNENPIGALSLTANSTLDLHAGDGTAGRGLPLPRRLSPRSRSTAAEVFADTLGPDDKIFIMADDATSGALSQIEFTSDAPGATRLGHEIMHVLESTNVALGVFGAVVVMFGIGHRLYARTNQQILRASHSYPNGHRAH